MSAMSMSSTDARQPVSYLLHFASQNLLYNNKSHDIYSVNRIYYSYYIIYSVKIIQYRLK